jgi:similar to spore coat protein
MKKLVKKLTGMQNMSNQIIATDMLLDLKNSINNYAIALTEATSTEIRSILRRHLNDTIAEHEALTKYMIENEYYLPFDFKEQVELDIDNTDTALNLTKPS